jgi:hypothetical protein
MADHDERLLPIAIEAYDGDTTSLELQWYDQECEPDEPDVMWVIAAVGPDSVSIIDYGYRSRGEVVESIEALRRYHPRLQRLST